MNVVTALSPAMDVRIREMNREGGMEARYLPMILARPLMNLMVRSVLRRRADGSILPVNHILFDGWGKFCALIRKGAASWEALNIIYNYRGEGSFLDWLWIGHMCNAQAVRNRKRLIVQQLRELATDIVQQGDTVKLLSLASGSAQAVFEAIGDMQCAPEIKLIDFDRSAGPYAMDIACRHKLDTCTTFKAGNLLKFDRKVLLGDFRPNIIEMAGLLDYLRDDEAVLLIRRIYDLLPAGGSFVTCHIHDNDERDFMTEVIEWGRDDGKQRPMLYRTQRELIELVRAGGFNIMTVFVEPHHIHSVVVAKK